MSQIELVKATRVRPLDDLSLEVEFSDGSSGVTSLAEFARIGPMMTPLGDPAFFRQVFLEMGVPTWPNGCDIDPTALRMKMRDAGTSRRPLAAE